MTRQRFLLSLALGLVGCFIVGVSSQDPGSVDTAITCPNATDEIFEDWCFSFHQEVSVTQQSQAEEYCKSIGKELATVKSLGQTFLIARSIFNRNWTDAMTGLKYESTPWQWAPNQSPVRGQGCYGNGFNSKSELETTLTSEIMTIDKCIEFCSDNRMLFSAIHMGSFCYCSHNFSWSSPASNCSQLCSGSSDQHCGGFLSSAVYSSADYSYDNWQSGRPSVYGNCAAVMADGLYNYWVDAGCAMYLPFICELDREIPLASAEADSVSCDIHACYYLYGSTTKTWSQAERMCRHKGGRLAVVSLQYTQNTVSRLLFDWDLRDAMVWIGATKMQWYFRDGSMMKYDGWIVRNEPLASITHSCSAVTVDPVTGQYGFVAARCDQLRETPIFSRFVCSWHKPEPQTDPNRQPPSIRMPSVRDDARRRTEAELAVEAARNQPRLPGSHSLSELIFFEERRTPLKEVAPSEGSAVVTEVTANALSKPTEGSNSKSSEVSTLASKVTTKETAPLSKPSQGSAVEPEDNAKEQALSTKTAEDSNLVPKKTTKDPEATEGDSSALGSQMPVSNIKVANSGETVKLDPSSTLKPSPYPHPDKAAKPKVKGKKPPVKVDVTTKPPAWPGSNAVTVEMRARVFRRVVAKSAAKRQSQRILHFEEAQNFETSTSSLSMSTKVERGVDMCIALCRNVTSLKTGTMIQCWAGDQEPPKLASSDEPRISSRIYDALVDCAVLVESPIESRLENDAEEDFAVSYVDAAPILVKKVPFEDSNQGGYRENLQAEYDSQEFNQPKREDHYVPWWVYVLTVIILIMVGCIIVFAIISRKQHLANKIGYESQKKVIYISYCRRRKRLKPLIEQIAQSLQFLDYEVRYDSSTFRSDISIENALTREISRADCVLVCYNEDYNKSETCCFEAQLASRKQKPFVPVRIEKGYQAIAWLTAFLTDKTVVDVIEGNVDAGLQNVAFEVERLFKRKSLCC